MTTILLPLFRSDTTRWVEALNPSRGDISGEAIYEEWGEYVTAVFGSSFLKHCENC